MRPHNNDVQDVVESTQRVADTTRDANYATMIDHGDVTYAHDVNVVDARNPISSAVNSFSSRPTRQFPSGTIRQSRFGRRIIAINMISKPERNNN